VFGSAVAALVPGGAAAESAVGAGAEEITLQLLYQLIVILLATRLVTAVVRRLGQTDVSGEILAGVLLGPSLLGALFPGFMHALFPVSTGPIFTGLAQVGLIFLMFQIGLEFEFARHLGGRHRSIVLIGLIGLAVPFVMGYLSAPWFHARLSEPAPLFGFQLFFAVAMSITAIPVLGRIFMELGLAHTRSAPRRSATSPGGSSSARSRCWSGARSAGAGRSRGWPASSRTWRSSSSLSASRFVGSSRTTSRATAACGSTSRPTS
jgi:hypothetical protein